MTPKVALALGSGAARGLAHAGVLEVLDEAGVKAQLAAGTSMGALFAALYSISVPAGEMVELARKMSIKHLLGLRELGLYKPGILDGDRVLSHLRRVTYGRSFSDTRIPLTVVATDFVTGEEVHITEGNLAEAIRASTSIPVLFTPFRMGDRLLADGGLVNPVPCDVAEAMGADVVLAVDVSISPEVHSRKSLLDREREISDIVGLLRIWGQGDEMDDRSAAQTQSWLIERIKRTFKGAKSLSPPFQIYNIIMQALNIMERELTVRKIPKDAVHVHVNFPRYVSWSDLHESEMIIQAGREAMEKALPRLEAALARPGP